MEKTKLTNKTVLLINKLIFLERDDVDNTDILKLVLKEKKYDFIQKIILNTLRDKNIEELRKWYGLPKIETPIQQPFQVDLKVDMNNGDNWYHTYYEKKIRQSCGVPITYVDGKEEPFTLFKDPPI